MSIWGYNCIYTGRNFYANYDIGYNKSWLSLDSGLLASVVLLGNGYNMLLEATCMPPVHLDSVLLHQITLWGLTGSNPQYILDSVLLFLVSKLVGYHRVTIWLTARLDMDCQWLSFWLLSRSSLVVFLQLARLHFVRIAMGMLL